MASLIHPSSSESVTSQLDLFSVPPTQTSLEDGFFTEYRPISVLTSRGPVEFCIAAESSNYIDLANTFLYIRALVTKADGIALAADTEITQECNFLHTLWSQCDLYLNDTFVAIARFAASINCTIVSQLQCTNQICPFFLSL